MSRKRRRDNMVRDGNHHERQGTVSDRSRHGTQGTDASLPVDYRFGDRLPLFGR